MNTILGQYKNGNYTVMLMSDGTKYRFCSEDKMVPEYPESMDLKICNKCGMMCPMCHEGSTPNGECADIMNMEFIDTLHPYTEIAIGGGNPLEHPQLVNFLTKLHDKHIIANMTVNQGHFERDIPFLKELCDSGLVHGLGVSYLHPDYDIVQALGEFPNAVVHIINGLVDINDMSYLFGHNLKLLILGYKEFRRGETLYQKEYEAINQRKKDMKDWMLDIIMDNFDVVSFDNLAIEQLDLRSRMTEEEWNRFYMGNDGGYTMYIDAVNGVFAKSSVSHTRFPMKNNIKDMFQKVRELG